jgi:hypothetical protein
MTQSVDRERAVRYLLGELPEAEREALEEQWFVQDDTLAELKEAEDDLVDAYGRGQLSPERRVLFEARYLQDESGRRRVEFAGALHGAIRARRPDLVAARRPQRAWAWAAVVTGVALAGALLGVARLRATLTRMEGERAAIARSAEEQRARAQTLAGEVERLRTQVGDLEARIGRGVEGVVTLALVSGLARDLQPVPSVTIGPDASRLALELRLKDDAFERYAVALETPDGQRVWSALATSSAAVGGRVLLVSVPRTALAPGHYVVAVEGLTQGQKAVPHAEYVFRVRTSPRGSGR